MRTIARRLAKLEAEHARNAPAKEADHGLSPEEYGRAYTEFTRLLSTHPTSWSLEEMKAMSGLHPHIDFRSASRDPAP